MSPPTANTSGALTGTYEVAFFRTDRCVVIMQGGLVDGAKHADR